MAETCIEYIYSERCIDAPLPSSHLQRCFIHSASHQSTICRKLDELNSQHEFLQGFGNGIHYFLRLSLSYYVTNTNKQQKNKKMSTARDVALDVPRLQALPVELQDMILDLLLNELPSNTTVIINNKYCSPWQLSIDRGIRGKVAQNYYGNNNFTWKTDDEKVLIRWLESLEPLHISLIKELRLPPLRSPWWTNPGSVTRKEQMNLAHIKFLVYRNWWPLRGVMDSVRLTTRLEVMEDGGDRWYSQEEVEKLLETL